MVHHTYRTMDETETTTPSSHDGRRIVAFDHCQYILSRRRTVISILGDLFGGKSGT